MNGSLRIDNEQTKLIFWLFYGSNLAAVLVWWLKNAENSCHIGGWGFTEFLINFQGGYVRRGLLGEVLHYICANTGCAPNYIFIPLCLVSFVGFCFLLGNIVKKLHFCWLVLLTNYGIFGGELIRKDYIIFLLLAAALWLYSNIKQRILRFSLPLSIIILILHIHESSFFYCVPVYLLILFSDNISAFSFVEKVAQVALITSTMGVICLCKGDMTTADAIVNSWQFAYPETYKQLADNSITALGWDALTTFRTHCKLNFVIGTIPYSGFILRPLALIVTLFLMVRMGLYRYLKSDILLVERFIYISLILALTLMPMFTVLSCDFQRVVFYWVISSIYALYYLKDRRIFLMNITIIQKGICGIRELLLKPYNGKIPYLLLLIFSIPMLANPLITYVTSIFASIARLVVTIAGILA